MILDALDHAPCRWCPELRAVRLHTSDPEERKRLRKEVCKRSREGQRGEGMGMAEEGRARRGQAAGGWGHRERYQSHS